DLAGSMNYRSATDYNVSSDVDARGLSVEQEGVHIRGVRATAKMQLNPRGIDLSGVTLDALGGRFTGKVMIPEMKRFSVDGQARNFAIQHVLSVFGSGLPAAGKVWSGMASGPVHVDGTVRGGITAATGKIEIVPAPGGIPVEGSIDAHFDGSKRTLNLGQSYLLTPGARVDLSGTLGSQLQVRAVSTNLNDLLPVINSLSKTRVEALPIQLKNGKASFDGTVRGNLSSPVIAGSVTVNGFSYEGVD